MLLVAPAARSAQPNIAIDDSPTLDSVCSVVRGGEIKDEWRAELVARKPEFEKLWGSVGPTWIATAESITGKPFPGGDITARLTLCNLPSQSIVGVSVNMRYALASFSPSPVPLRYKVHTLFHELLHVFLVRHPVADSRLLAEHASESRCIRNHLHLIALHKAILLQLAEVAVLNEIVALDTQLPNGCYKRAWALVSATETEYLRYVKELAR